MAENTNKVVFGIDSYCTEWLTQVREKINVVLWPIQISHVYVVLSWVLEDNTYISHWNQTAQLYFFQGCLILIRAGLCFISTTKTNPSIVWS